MTAAFSTNERDNIIRSAHYVFGCHQYTTGVRNEPPERRKKRDRITATIDRGFEVLESDNPPQSREEAIRRIVGVAAMLVAFLFPQYRLAIQVAGWLWDYIYGVGVTGER